MLRNEDDTHTLQISEPFNLILTGDKEADLEYNTRRLAKVIEERIRLTPAQWMWSYERFTHDISGMTADLESLVI
jgi:lauroyl/myristoyl acyltransferase